MGIFKKNDSERSGTPPQGITPESTPRTKKKIRIGFGHRPQQQPPQSPPQEIQVTEEVTYGTTPQKSDASTGQPCEDVDLFLDEVTKNDAAMTEQIRDAETPDEPDWTATKRRAFAQRDMKGKHVYLEDTGEKIGIVFDAVHDAENNLIGYKIKDSKSETILSFPLDQFDEDKNGLIFIPSWYMRGMKTIEKLEFKDRITPELIWLIKDNTVSTEELYKIFIKHDDKIVNYIEEAVALRDLVNNRLKILEKERMNLKQTLMDLTEKRLIKDIDRRQFSEIVMEHRRKVNIVDINIKKCKDLLTRLEHTSFGMLSSSLLASLEKKEPQEPYHRPPENRRAETIPEPPREDPYKQKYFELRNEYGRLQEGYNELKIAVEKLLNKNEL